MNSGKIFESNFKTSCKKEGIFVLRLRDAAQSWEKAAIYTHENPYDFLTFKAMESNGHGALVCLELKHTIKNSFTIQRDNDASSNKMIKAHQVQGLYEAQKHFGVKAGFLFNFSYTDKEGNDSELTFFMNINNFMKFLQENDKKSINANDIVTYGAITVDQEKLRKNYHYKIGKLIDDIDKICDGDAF